MKWLIVFLAVICFTFVSVIASINIVKAQETVTKMGTVMDTYKGPTVTISGKVSASAEDSQAIKENSVPISIMAKSQLGARGPAIARTTISEPGKYSFKVPRDIGKIYVVLQKRAVKVKGVSVGGQYPDPVIVGSSDVTGIDMRILVAHGETTVYMDSYHGPVVTISGRVDANEKQSEVIKKGFIIFARVEPHPNSLIVATVPIFEPGEYFLKVPANFGKVYVLGVRLGVRQSTTPTGTPPTLTCSYKGNPINIGSADIKGIDLSVVPEKEKEKVYMDTYKGPTVTISGKISAKDYKKTAKVEILIGARTKLGRGSVTVAKTVISEPGEYSLTIPKDYGNVYIGAVQQESGQIMSRPGTVRGTYKSNPVNVGSSDIKGLNIEISSSNIK